MNPDNRRVFFLILTVAAVVILVTVALLILLFRQTAANISKPFASNISSAYQVDEDTLYFFAGSSFAAYDLSSHTTKELSPFYGLPLDVSEVIFSKRGALVRASGYSALDILYQTIADKGFNKFGSYWWLFDFDTKTQTLIGSAGNEPSVTQAVWLNNDTYAFNERTADGNLNLMIAEIGHAPTKVATLGQNANLEAATQDNVYYTDIQDSTRRSLIQIDVTNGQKTDLTPDYTVTDVLTIKSDGSALLLANDYILRPELSEDEEQGEGEIRTGQLMLYESSTKKLTSIEKNFSGTAATRLDGDQWVAVGRDGNGRPLVIFGSDKGVTKLSASLDYKQDYVAIGENDSGALVVNNYNEVFYISQKEVNRLPTLQNSASLLGSSVFNSKFQMIYESSNRNFNFYIVSPSNKEGVDAVIDYIRSKGIDPYQIKTKFYGNNGSDLSQ